MSTTILTEKETKKTGRPTDSSETKQDIKHSQSTGTSKKTATKPPAMKRDQSSIFQQFSKAKPKISREGTGSSVDTSPAVTTPQSVCTSMGSLRRKLHLLKPNRKSQVPSKTVRYRIVSG